LLGYSYSPFTRLVTYCHRRPRNCHGRAPRRRSVLVLHCLVGRCQRLGFSSNVCNPTSFLVAPAPPLFFFHCQSLRVSLVVYQLFTLLVSTARFFLLIPAHVFMCIFLFDPLVGVGFLILGGWCAVCLVPERLGLMAFSLVPGWRKNRGRGSLFPITSAARSLCSQ